MTIFKIIFIYSLTLLQVESEFDSCKIVWSSDRILTWDDFHVISEDSAYAYSEKDHHKSASSYVITSMDFEIEERTGKHVHIVDIEVFFDCDRSWVKEKSSNLLEHEQLHFDITELYARKLRKAIGKRRFKENSYSKEVHELKAEIWEELDQEQSIFDLETNYSLNEARQSEWRVKIKKELERLERYSGTKVTI